MPLPISLNRQLSFKSAAYAGLPIGATLTKSTEESIAYGYGYKYKYGAIDKDRTEIVMLAHQPHSGSGREG